MVTLRTARARGAFPPSTGLGPQRPLLLGHHQALVSKTFIFHALLSLFEFEQMSELSLGNFQRRLRL